MEKSLCTCKHCCLCVKCCHLLGFIRRHSTSNRPHLTMPPRRKLSNFDRARAVAWFQDGGTKREVARRLQVSISVIVRLIQCYIATGRVQERRRSGRPKKTNPREDRLIERQALQTRAASSSIIRRHVRVAANINISQQTIRNRLHGFYLRSRRPAVRPRLAPAHRAARRTFCRRHVRWTRHQWSKVLFSDESRFTMNHNDGRLRVWRRPGQRFIDATVQEKVALGGGSVMVWGAFSLHHRTPLYRVQGNLNGLRYRDEILRPLAVPTLQQIGPMLSARMITLAPTGQGWSTTSCSSLASTEWSGQHAVPISTRLRTSGMSWIAKSGATTPLPGMPNICSRCCRLSGRRFHRGSSPTWSTR